MYDDDIEQVSDEEVPQGQGGLLVVMVEMLVVVMLAM